MAAPSLPSSQGGIPSGPPSAAAARAIVARVSESFKYALAQQRPWQELVDRTSFAKPDSLADASNRVKKNIGYFRANYSVVLLIMVILSMLTSPFSIFWLCGLALAWGYIFMVRTDPIVISGRVISDREKFFALTAITVLIVFVVSKVGSILISGLLVGTVAIVAHATMRVPDDLFLDDQDAGGFLSFLGPSQLPTSIGHV